MKIITPLIILFGFLTVRSQPQKQRIKHRYIYESDLAFVPEQKIINTTCNDSVFFPNLKGDTVLVESFYMSRTEVSNISYHRFLNYLTLVEEDSIAWENNYPDTLVWSDVRSYSYGDDRSNNYFWHPAYDDYPVVGLTYDQCKKYCEWLTKMYNEDPSRKFKKVEFLLPARAQFIAASVCGKGKRVFAFEGNEWINRKGAKLNLNNRKPYEIEVQKNICYFSFNAVNANCEDGAWYTNKVISYEPNEYGIFNLCGNVEEFLDEYGFVKGGSWDDLLKETTLMSEEKYTVNEEKSAQRGFRFIMKVIEK